jgi:hypothetical protein
MDEAHSQAASPVVWRRQMLRGKNGKSRGPRCMLTVTATPIHLGTFQSGFTRQTPNMDKPLKPAGHSKQVGASGHLCRHPDSTGKWDARVCETMFQTTRSTGEARFTRREAPWVFSS